MGTGRQETEVPPAEDKPTADIRALLSPFGPEEAFDLLMLALFASRERDEAQWNGLFAAAGWEPTRIDDGLIEAVCR